MLKDIPIFSCLNDDEIDNLEKVALRKTYPKNTILFSEGDTSDSLYVITKGRVKVVINDETGKEIIISLFGPGEYFGEMALIDGEPRSANIVTREPTQVIIISRNDFKRTFQAHPDIAFNLLKGMLQRLREANKKIESLALMDVYGRIARLLTQFAEPKDDVMVVNEPLTHQDIANMIGSSREMVSRILKELITGEFVTVRKRQITINKKLPYSW